MAPTVVSCPDCATRMRVPPDHTPGMQVRCTSCYRPFPIPDEADAAASAGGARHASRSTLLSERWMQPAPPLDRGPEYHPDDRVQPQRGGEERPVDLDAGVPFEGAVTPSSLLPDNRFTVSFSDWIACGMTHIWSYVVPAIGFMIVTGVIGAVRHIEIVGPFLEFALSPALQAGFSVVALRLLRGQSWSFGDFFGGFAYFVPLLVLRVLEVLLMVALLGPGIGLALYGALGDGPPECISAGVGLLVCLGFPFFYLYVRCFFFATQFVLDQNLGAVQAIRTNWHLTAQSPLSLLGAGLLLTVIALIGLLACFVGVLFTYPLALLAWNAGYLLALAPRASLDRDPGRSRNPEDEFRSGRVPDDFDRRYDERGREGRDRYAF